MVPFTLKHSGTKEYLDSFIVPQSVHNMRASLLLTFSLHCSQILNRNGIIEASYQKIPVRALLVLTHQVGSAVMCGHGGLLQNTGMHSSRQLAGRKRKMMGVLRELTASFAASADLSLLLMKIRVINMQEYESYL